MSTDTKVNPVAFSSDGESAIHRTFQTTSSIYPSVHLEGTDLESYFEISRCLEWMETHGFMKTCLQFPDELLQYSIQVTQILETRSSQKRVHILADTTYGSCCVDTKTASHCGSDSIIHFGSACLSGSPGTIPILYIFTQWEKDFDVSGAVGAFKEVYDPETHEDQKILILYDVTSERSAKKVYQELLPVYQDGRILFAELVLPQKESTTNQSLIHGRHISCPTEVTHIFYIGRNEKTIFNFLLHFPSIPFNVYDPYLQSVNTKSSHITKFLLQRNYYVEKIKDATSIGILIASLSVEDHLKIISQIKETLKKAGKKYYIVSIGEITPPKLANFPDIELFVLVSCPESWIWNSKEFYQPIVMPYELEIALNKGREWKGDYVVDYRLLLPGGQNHVNLEIGEENDVSLITGGLRQASVSTASGDLWRGIDNSETLRSEVHEGKSGIPQHYINEPMSK